MQKVTEQHTENSTAGFIAKNRRRRIRKRIVSILACIVVFCTTYALILPALTLEKSQNSSEEAPAVNSAAVSSDETWGYNADGSIWWGVEGLDIVKEIKENTPYLITGYRGNTIMTGEPKITSMAGDNGTYEFTDLAAIPDGEGTDYQTYEYWYFEKAEGDKSYYIYYMTADGQKKYLQFTHNDLVIWNNETRNIILNENKAEATVFTVERVKDLPSQSSETYQYPNHIVAYVEEGGKKFFINSYYGDNPTSSTHFWGYPEASAGSFLKVCRHDEIVTVNTANRIEAANSPNSVINLFDYWVSENQTDRDNVFAPLNGGINENHALKFVCGDQSDAVGMDLNLWTGKGKNPRQGIVEKTLGEDGYPVLSGAFPVEGCDSNESLEYLFNTKTVHNGKQSHRNVGGLLSIDSEGYYSFDSKTHMAEFNREKGSFSVYDKPGAQDSFFPFNVAPQVMMTGISDSKINHYFGLTLTTRFVQRHGGHTDERRNTPTTFYFSGDDDVWIFIDGVLVGDVGGIHDASDVSINFATGDVEIGVASGEEAPIRTTLRECYEAAGKADATKWNSGNNTTYADNSVHTLKFFFLERGNYESNLTLRYNLTEIPETAIYKVDQYGAAVPDAGFAVYAADENYQMLSEKNGSPVTLPADAEPLYDADSNITDSGGNILANALYTGVTNNKGEMIFVDQDGMPLSINELEDMFGQHFILRETKVPEGYRIISKDVHLTIWQGAVQKILRCENTTVSGTRASPTLQVTATDLLHLRRPYNGSTVVEYCNEKGETKGKLFAVVYKYAGEINAEGQATQLADESLWEPVWGNEKDGYTVVPLDKEEPNLQTAELNAALEATKASVAKYGEKGTVFELSSSSTMQVTIESLPGSITKYFSMLGADQKGDARYSVVYYWTDQENLQNATPENTFRVYTFGEKTQDGISFSAFERVFGANIHVPNLINNLMIQKQDVDGTLLNGATFAIYPVNQLDDANGTLKAKASDGSTVTFPKEALPNPDTGAITADGKTIMPLQTDTTRTFSDGIHIGTAEFANLPNGQYIVKEIKALTGYKVNKSDVMVLVTDDTIYANAGTEEDGIAIGRGPGYIANPLNMYASEGQIDNTLSWIYARMLISDPSTKFKDATSTGAGWGYLTENFTSKKGEKYEAIISYLKYSPDVSPDFNGEEKYNYITNEERSAEVGVQNPSKTRRLFTTVGWNHYAILQDYDYGSAKAQLNGANYENLSKDGEEDRNIMHLFSRSTYIMVMDEREDNALVVNKIDAYNETVGLTDAQFRLYKLGADGEMQYYVRKADDGTVEWSTVNTEALTATTDSSGLTPQSSFTGLSDGTYYLEEVKAPDGYHTLAKPLQLTFENGKFTLDAGGQSGKYSVSEGVFDEATNRFVYTVTVPNYTDQLLPATGGAGIKIYVVCGLVLMALSSVCLIYKNKKRRKEDTPTF